jgi:hypothetical protein
MPGNAGGAKGPDFWCAFEDSEVVVIGDKPENTIKDRRRPRLLCRETKESYPLYGQNSAGFLGREPSRILALETIRV